MILTRKSCVFNHFSAKNGWLIAFNLFHMFTQSIKFYTFHYHVLRVQMFEIHQIDSKNECLVASFGRSYGKICVGFCINT